MPTKKAAAPKAKAESKSALVISMIRRKNGCTRAAVLKATGWPSLSFQAVAASAGIDLAVKKEAGEPTRYLAK